MNRIICKNLVHRSLAVISVFLSVAMLLIACAPQAKFNASTQPDWINGHSQKFTTAHYFVGKGQAAALDVAAKRARAALAESLPGLAANVSSTALDELVQQAEVVDAWRDVKTRQHYALVVLEHAAATNMLRQQLAVLDTKTRQLIESATQGVSPLLQIRATHDALATQQTRADLLLALQSLGVDASADSAVWSITEMQVHLKSLLSSIDVAPRTEGNRQLGSAVVRGLDAAGYLSTRAQPSYVLKTTLQRSGMKWEQGRFTESGMLSVQLLDRQQQVVGKAQWPLKAQAEERMMLEKHLMNEVTNTLREQLAETVLGLTAE
jgi:hypothetical protein